MSEGIKYGAVDLISVDQILYRTKMRLQLKDSTDYDSDILIFINEAAASLKTKPTFRKKNCKLEIVDGKISLPCGFKKLLGVRMINQVPTTTSPLVLNSFNDVLYLETTYLNDCVSEFTSNVVNGTSLLPIFNGTMQRVGNTLIFPIPCSYTHCVMSYNGYATTADDGLLEMHPIYEKGFSEYARGMILSSYPQMWDNSWGSRQKEIELSLQIWANQFDMLVSTAFSDALEENKYVIKRVWNSLLMSQNSY